MPPYRANPGGAFNSGLFPAPVARIDVGDAIRALGQSATSLLETTYIRKVAERNRDEQKRQQAAERARQAERDRLTDEMARENLRLRQETLRLQQERADRDARPNAPTPQWSESRGGWIVPPSAEAPEGRFIAPNGLPAAAVSPAQARQEKTQAEQQAEEDAASAVWLERNRKNPEVVAMLGTIFRNNPELARTPNRAASILRRAMPDLGAPAGAAGAGSGRAPTRPNVEQEKSFLFWRNMSAANPVISRVGPRANLDRVSAALSATTTVSAAAANRLLTPEEQQLVSAIRAFGEPILRKNTGAAFGNDEILWVFQQFVPLSGDAPGTVQMKTANRVRILDDFGTLALPARQYYDAVQGGQPTSQPTPDEIENELDNVLSRRRP